MMKLYTFIALLFIAINSEAQTFSSPTGIATSVTSGVYNLTPASSCDGSYHAGAVWTSGTISFNNSFILYFKAKFDIVRSGGADGICVVFGQNLTATSLNGNAGYLGYYDPDTTAPNSAFQKSFNVEMDIFDNGSLVNDPSPYSDHMMIARDGNCYHTIASNVSIRPSAISIKDSSYHDYRIEWCPYTQKLKVYFDDSLRINSNFDYRAIFTKPDSVKWGFSGGIGASCSDQFVKGISMITDTTCIRRIDTLTISDTMSCRTVKFTGHNTDTAITSYMWDFGDSTTGTGNPVTHTYAANGTYQVRLVTIDTFGYHDTAYTNVVINILPMTYTISDTEVACDVYKFKANYVSGDSSSTFLWLFGDSTSATGNPVTHAYAVIKTYFVKLVLTNASGCTDTVKFTVYDNLHRMLYDIADSQINCKEALFTATHSYGDTAVTYKWLWGDSTSTSGIPATHLFRTSGTHKIKLALTNYLGCRDTASYTFTFGPPVINYNITDSVINCKKAQLAATYTSGDTATQFLWLFADGTASSANPTTHTYTGMGTHTAKLVLTNALGCSDSVNYAFDLQYFVPIKAKEDTSICKNDTVQLHALGGVIYHWQPDYNITSVDSATPFVAPDNSTTYVVTGTDSIGCTGSDSVFVRILQGPELNLSSDGRMITCHNSSVQLFASGAIKYAWSPAIYCNDSTSASPIVSPPDEQEFYVVGIDSKGCRSEDSIRVTSDKTVMVFVPSGFTPNNDGKNDKVYPIVFCDFVLERFNVYDRWGERVFSTATYKDGWDGTFNGQPMEMGTYFYYIRGHKPTGEHVILKGDITLIR